MKHLRWLTAVMVLVGCGEGNDPQGAPPAAGAGGGAAAAAGRAAGGAGAEDDGYVCETGRETVPGSMLHAAAFEVMTAAGAPGPSGIVGACSFGSCHVSPRGKGMLVLKGMPDLTALVDQPACEVPSLSLVASGGGNAALRNSYLWIKMVGPVEPNSDVIVGQPGWGAGGVTACGDITADTPFGVRMPKNGGLLYETGRAHIRRWICAGAPPP